MSIKFALLGAGRIGKTHAVAINANHNAELVAVFDPVTAAAAAIGDQYGCAILDLDAIARAEDIDVVAICTPTNTHADLIEKYARAGKVIFCEKPIDLDLNRVKECLRTVSDTNTKLMVGFNRRFDPHFIALRQAIDANQIGAVEQVVITSRDPDLPPMEYIAVSGGIFRDMSIHDFDMARFILNEEIESVFATGSVLVDSEVEKYHDFDSAMIVMRTYSGKQVVINNSRRATYGYDQRIEVHGVKGMVRAANPHPLMCEIASGAGYNRAPLHNFFMTRYKEAYTAEFDALIKAMASETPLSPSGDDALIALALAEAALISVREERMVKVREVLDI